jgi:hypothetical protein
MRGFLSKYWGLAVSANLHFEDNNDKGEDWVRKTILHLWDFGHEMWEHRNAMLLAQYATRVFPEDARGGCQ